MRKREALEICSSLDQISEACKDIMQVDTSFLDKHIPRPRHIVRFPGQIGSGKAAAVAQIFSADRGVSIWHPQQRSFRGGARYTTASRSSTLEELEAYDTTLVKVGLGALASARARAQVRRERSGVTFYPSIEGRRGGPADPKRASLTFGLLRAIKALSVVSQVDLADQNISEKVVAKKTKKLAQAVISIAIAYPEKIYLPAGVYIGETTHSDVREFLPAGTYTRTQALGLGQLRPFWQERSMRAYAERAEKVVDNAEALPDIDVDTWTTQLQRAADVWTPQEREERAQQKRDENDSLRRTLRQMRQRDTEATSINRDLDEESES